MSVAQDAAVLLQGTHDVPGTGEELIEIPAQLAHQEDFRELARSRHEDQKSQQGEDLRTDENDDGVVGQTRWPEGAKN